MRLGKFKFLLSFTLILFLYGCVSKPQTGYEKQQGNKTQWYYHEVGAEIKPDPEIVKVIEPYKVQLEKEMKTVIGYAETDLTRGKPEGTLGDFVADAMLETARKFIPQTDCAITNNGGLRAPIFKGNIKVENIFNLMPFANRIVILEFSGKDFIELIRQIVENGGEPVSNLTITVTDGLIEAYVGDKKVEDYKTYKVATIDYLWKGGGSMPLMKKGKLVKDTKVLLREALIEYVKEHKKINQKIEGRIVIQ